MKLVRALQFEFTWFVPGVINLLVKYEMTALYRHILVPVDFTPKNESAIQIAQAMAERDLAKLTLAHIVHQIEDTYTGEFETFYDSLLHNASIKLNDYSSELRKSVLEVLEHLVVGKPLFELVRFIEESDVDLIVLSSHRIEFREGGLTWGTLSYQLSIVSPCQVLLVK